LSQLEGIATLYSWQRFRHSVINVVVVKNETMTSTASPGQLHSDYEKMVCKNCFRSKADGGVAVALQCLNPKCQFYECSPTSSLSSDDAIKVESRSNSSSNTFAREVGYSRRVKTAGQREQMDVQSSVWKFPSSKSSLNFELQVLSNNVCNGRQGPEDVAGSQLTPKDLPKRSMDYDLSRKPWMSSSRLFSINGGTASDSFLSSSLTICEQVTMSSKVVLLFFFLFFFVFPPTILLHFCLLLYLKLHL